MKPLEDFCKDNRPKHGHSKLFPFRAEIFELVEKNYSSYSIVRFLSEVHKIEVSRRNVDKFVEKNIKHKIKESTSYAKQVQTPVNVSPANTYNKKQETNTGPKYVYGVKMDESHPSVKKWKEEEKRIKND